MLKNKLLQQAAGNIQGKAKDPAMLKRLVDAGLKIIYDKNVFQKLTQELRASKDPAGDVGRGMLVVLKLMATKARGTIPPAALLQAGMVLVLDALDFLEQAGMLQVDAAALDHATQEYVEATLPALGVQPDRMQQVLGQIQQVAADPQKMAEYRQSLGGAGK